MEGLRGATNKTNRVARNNNKKLLDQFQAGLEMSQSSCWHSSFMLEMQYARERICHGGSLVGGYDGDRESSNDSTSRRFFIITWVGHFKKGFQTFFLYTFGLLGWNERCFWLETGIKNPKICIIILPPDHFENSLEWWSQLQQTIPNFLLLSGHLGLCIPGTFWDCCPPRMPI